MSNSYEWIKSNGGIMKAADYPYVEYYDDCYQDKQKLYLKVQKYHKLSVQNETRLSTHIYENGPIAVSFNGATLQFYTGGVIDADEATCDPDDINHSAVIVGFAYDDYVTEVENYWIVKNSFGEDWGENGYARIARGKGTCGINKYLVDVTIE